MGRAGFVPILLVGFSKSPSEVPTQADALLLLKPQAASSCLSLAAPCQTSAEAACRCLKCVSRWYPYPTTPKQQRDKVWAADLPALHTGHRRCAFSTWRLCAGLRTAWESFCYLPGTAGLCSRAVGRNLAVLKPLLPSLGSEVAVFHAHSCSRKDVRVAGVFGNALCRVSCSAFPVSPQEHPSAERGL